MLATAFSIARHVKPPGHTYPVEQFKAQEGLGINIVYVRRSNAPAKSYSRTRGHELSFRAFPQMPPLSYERPVAEMPPETREPVVQTRNALARDGDSKIENRPKGVHQAVW